MALLGAFGGVWSAAALAGDVTLYGGALESDTHQETYSWALEYRQPIDDSFAASLIWLNEGHITNHHRDGQGAQVWWRSQPVAGDFYYEFGAGPYLYYDTTRAGEGQRSEDAHGFGVLMSAGIGWNLDRRWYTTMRLNEVRASDSFNTTSLVLGLGFRFEPLEANDQRDRSMELEPALIHWELDALGGVAIANNFRSQDSALGGLGVRTDLNHLISLSAQFLDTGADSVGWRTGVTAQAWLGTALTPRWSIAAGAGAFVPVDEIQRIHRSPPSNPSAVIGVAAGYQLSAHWQARVIWDRIGTGDGRDADLYQLVVGYRF